MSILNLGVVENGVAHTRKEIRFLVYGSAYTSVLDRLQKHLVNRILTATPVTRNRRREQQQCRPMLPIQDLDLGGISFRPAHFAVSMLRQSARMDLSMSAELLCWAALNPGKSNGMYRLDRAPGMSHTNYKVALAGNSTRQSQHLLLGCAKQVALSSSAKYAFEMGANSGEDCQKRSGARSES